MKKTRKTAKMRTIQTTDITENIRQMCIEANHYLSDDMKQVFNKAVDNEESPLGRQVLEQLKENLEIASSDMIPICQDTGMAVIFMNVGQEVHFEGGSITDAVNEGVRQGYTEGYLTKSVVGDPIIRENTKDNTPAWQRCAEQLRNCAMKQEMKDMLKARMKRSLRMRLSFSDMVS